MQASALAPTAAEAEVLAKAAVLSGPARAGQWLTHGGLIVRDDGSYEPIDPAAARSVAPTRASQPGEHVARAPPRARAR